MQNEPAAAFPAAASLAGAAGMTANQRIAASLEEAARILSAREAGRFRVQAYVHAAGVLRLLGEPAAQLLAREGLAGLERLPGVGETMAHVIREVVLHGREELVERLRGAEDPIALLASVPGIGTNTAWRLHEELGIDTLPELEAAARDGRLARLAGIGRKRLAGVRDTLAMRLGRPPPRAVEPAPS